MDSFIHETASLKDVLYDEPIKIFRNVSISKSKLAGGCSIGDDTTVERSALDNNVSINRRSYINDSFIGKYTYSGINTTINWARIGKFCSIARNVDIGGFDHDYHKITTMPAFRFHQIRNGGGKLAYHEENDEYCEIGNDVWIAAGAQILHKVKIGDGAVIGGGAVVTHDVPPYAIVAGVPARIIGYRCAPNLIDALEEIKWWDWPEELLLNTVDEMIVTDIDEASVERLKELKKNYDNGLSI